MLWYKSWLETRWRFLIGFALLLMMACSSVASYPRVARLLPDALPLVRDVDTTSVVGRQILRAIDAQSTYRGFVWWQWVQDNLSHTWTLLAILLGTGGLLAQTRGGAAIFTLSLPVSRGDLLRTRATTALAELFVLALVPSLLPPLLSPLIGQHYSLVDALVHALCVFVGGTVFFSLATLLSTVFSDLWRPALLACVVAVALFLVEPVLLGDAPYGIVGAMTAEAYFRSGALPWPGLVVSAAASVAMLYAAALNINQLEV
ncbi:MAG TPA: hypothetical protein VFA27_11695 [Vicinamibacterales bacterium]|nr:hypothetical protein [Vicinamibacterales bacterium]